MLALRDHFVARQHELLALTCALVEAESPSGDKDGSSGVVSLLASAAASITNVNSVERIASENFGEHIAVRAFAQPDNTRSILVLGHTDTVHPRGVIKERPWRAEGNRVYGPGIFDMKVDCAVALEALRACEAAGIKTRSAVTILLTCDEESGSPTGRPLVESEARKARATLVIEPPASGGRVKTARKGTGMFTIEVKGRAAHAGLDPEKGISAVLELAKQTAASGKSGRTTSRARPTADGPGSSPVAYAAGSLPAPSASEGRNNPSQALGAGSYFFLNSVLFPLVFLSDISLSVSLTIVSVSLLSWPSGVVTFVFSVSPSRE